MFLSYFGVDLLVRLCIDRFPGLFCQLMSAAAPPRIFLFFAAHCCCSCPGYVAFLHRWFYCSVFRPSPLSLPARLLSRFHTTAASLIFCDRFCINRSALTFLPTGSPLPRESRPIHCPKASALGALGTFGETLRGDVYQEWGVIG